ncbi:PREDICTED: nuclear transcription factor Y subunit B-3 isoform X3 [Erythranthe guttata]|uniref:nuclear transcription factor Y subunit B-3 isoform X2 n=1 Tax=Erythranthe guttata TaxID=4155 RepID=UPI00064DDF17|nr:PREDICTED: nuclear transcription factor Y subunit B-3 isoform X2 [Erythranthe guttata]XP_012845672.1 PREDICTED: nuclear transcription factor Y subunit B-3 isoform X3 [Erythranthe guttata]|eukprot:XP_012845671.1 PREDICTED: nuclear transcription factor Y subunit B-3 isoform X2 [Erythranthe guttata]
MKRERDFEDESSQFDPNTTFGTRSKNSFSTTINNNNNNNNDDSNIIPIPNNPTKSTTIIEDDENNNSNNSNSNNNNNNKEQDRFLPIANVGRIMKKVIPGNGKISKDAKETVQECVSEFISFVTGEASEKCQREKRKTINGDDVLWAIMTLGFEDYVNPLKLYLAKYREIEGEKLNVPKQQRMEQQQQQQPMQHDPQKTYSSTNMMSQQSFSSGGDPSFPLPFSQNSLPPHAFDPNW